MGWTELKTIVLVDSQALKVMLRYRKRSIEVLLSTSVNHQITIKFPYAFSGAPK